MKGAFWNIRGLNKSGRMKCLADFISSNKLDFVGIQETKKNSFTDGFLEAVSRNMTWHYVPAKGTAGGILVGLIDACFSILSCQDFQFGTAIMIKNNANNFIWRVVVIYGPAYEENKKEFIEELHLIMGSWNGPTLLGGILI
jgi:exonuclease III